MAWDSVVVDGTTVDYAADHNEEINQIKARTLAVSGALDDTTIAATTPLKFGLTPTVADPITVGSIYWKASSQTATIQCALDVEVPIGQKEVRRVYNPSPTVTIAKGVAVYTLAAVTAAGIVHVALAKADSLSTSDVLGIVAAPIPPETVGWVVVRGTVSNLDTSGFSAAGATMYLSAATAGAIVETLPISPNFEVRLGRVLIKDGSNGRYNIRIFRTLALDNLADVSVPSPVANQLLKFNGVSWIAADSSTVSSAGGTDLFPTGNHVSPIEGLSVAAVCEVTYTAHGMATGASVFFRGITQANWTILNSTATVPKKYVITVTGLNTFTIPVDSQTFGAYVPLTDPGTYSIGKLMSAPDTTITTQTDSADSTNDTEVLMSEFVTPAPMGRTDITGGEWSFKTWCYADSTTNVNTIVIRVYKMNTSGTATELFNVQTADLGTVNTLSQITTVQPAYTILATDHLVLRYYAKSDRTTGVRSLYMTHNGTTQYSFVKTPISLGHASLGQLTYATAGHVGFAPTASPTFTGDVTIPAGTHSISIRDYVTLMAASCMVPVTTPATVDQAEIAAGNTYANYVYIEFAKNASTTVGTQFIQWANCMPSDWNGGNLTAVIDWLTTGADTTNKTKFIITARRYATATDLATALTTGVTTAEQASAGAGYLNLMTETAAFTVTGTGNWIVWSLTRVAPAGTDLNATVRVLGMKIKYIRTLS